jgi:2-polyprenyl-3-methyl-5-hydroxy-6-metoxy-1,4-benzoquinol methylase
MESDFRNDPQSNSSQERGYFSCVRHDIIRHICTPEIKTILSVGCAYGCTEKVLIQQYGKTIYGIEYDKEALKIARENGVYIIGDDANKINPSKIDMVFDCILFSDVLEHLCDPLDVLKKCLLLLKEGGVICISIPNFRHYSVLHALFFRGAVRYTDGGILDKSHLRITTAKMAKEWLDTCNLKPRTTEYIFWGRRNKWMSSFFLNMLDDFIAHQVIVVGEKMNPAKNIDIV